MAEIHELINRVDEPELRAQLQAAVDKLAKQKKFGLVFEGHLPECTPLYDVPIKKGRMVARKRGEVSQLYVILKISDDVATCVPKNGGDVVALPVADLVSVAEFGEPIYPCLKPMDAVCNAPDSDLWHTLMEADNYHALQLLEYLYTGKVDCIYIDPPYNTGAKDWKYNNDYVDGSDTYRHSKWLSMMQKRLVGGGSKAKGLARYAEDEPNIGRVQLIREIKVAGKSKFKRLDFSKGDVRKKALKAINTDELDHIFDEHGKVE